MPITAPTNAMTPIEGGGLFSVSGLRGAAVKTGVKESGDLDLALIVADEPMNVAAVFTKNAMAAAPVRLGREILKQTQQIRAIVINSGNANALTGQRGRRDAQRMLEETEAAVNGKALVLSTGIIGVPLPIEKISDGIARAAQDLQPDGGDVAEAMLTTDTKRKTAACEINVGDCQYRVGGVAKGSGMIHPNMATMLAVVATDAPISSAAMPAILRNAVDASFHRISVDGDTSTNDAVVLLARPLQAGESIDDDAMRAVETAITQTCRALAQSIVCDAEGSTRVMDIEVIGAQSDIDAKRITDSIATSSLVKTALAGANPNWGRIISAAGNAGVDLVPENITLELEGQVVFENGEVIPADEGRLNDAFAKDRVAIRLTVGDGPATRHMLASDLSKRYVEINSEYTT